MRASQKQTEKRLKYSQNEEDDTGSRYQKIPPDDGNRSNLGGVQDRRAEDLVQSIRSTRRRAEEKLRGDFEKRK